MKTQNPLIGRSTGKFSNAIFQTLYGQNIVRSRPIQVRDAESHAQLTLRSKFFAALLFVRMTLFIYRHTFQNQTSNNSCYNAAMSYILMNSMQETGGIWSIDPTLVVFSFGSLTGLGTAPVINFDVDNKLVMTWTNNSGTGNATGTDIITLVIWNATTGICYQVTGTRADETMTVDGLNTKYSIGDELHLYYYMETSDYSNISDSAYIEETTITEQINSLSLLFDSSSNFPSYTLNDWNTFFDLPTNGTAFTELTSDGNTLILKNSGNITIKEYCFYDAPFIPHIVSISDPDGIITTVDEFGFFSDNVYLWDVLTTITLSGAISIGSAAFALCTYLNTINLASTISVGASAFTSCPSLTTINLPSCTSLGTTPGIESVFDGTTGNTITAYFNSVLATNNSGNPDVDIVFLTTNNTVTINWV